MQNIDVVRNNIDNFEQRFSVNFVQEHIILLKREDIFDDIILLSMHLL